MAVNGTDDSSQAIESRLLPVRHPPDWADPVIQERHSRPVSGSFARTLPYTVSLQGLECKY